MILPKGREREVRPGFPPRTTVWGQPGKPSSVSFADLQSAELCRKMGDAPAVDGKCSSSGRVSHPEESPRKHRRLRMKGSRQVRGNFCRQEPVGSGSVTEGVPSFRSREHRSRPKAMGRTKGVWDSVAQKAMEPLDVHVFKGK